MRPGEANGEHGVERKTTGGSEKRDEAEQMARRLGAGGGARTTRVGLSASGPGGTRMAAGRPPEREGGGMVVGS